MGSATTATPCSVRTDDTLVHGLMDSFRLQ